jgi:hypothetical protein
MGLNGHSNAAVSTTALEREMARDIGLHNFIPYIQVHEFEALLFVEPGHFADWVDSRVVEILRKVRECNAPEDINDDPHTAPSKRILAAMPDYQKTVHGPLIACDIGLDGFRQGAQRCAQRLKRFRSQTNSLDR